MVKKELAVGIDIGGTNTVFGFVDGRVISLRGEVENNGL